MKKRDLVILVFLFIRFVNWSQSFSTIDTRQICPSTSNSSVGKYQKLEFGFKFNQPINNFPKFLHTLYLDDGYEQPINNLPNTLYVLNVWKKYKYEIDNLPEKCELVII